MTHCYQCGTFYTGWHNCNSLTYVTNQPYVTPNVDFQILTELQKIGALLERFMKHQEREADRSALAAHWNG